MSNTVPGGNIGVKCISPKFTLIGMYVNAEWDSVDSQSRERPPWAQAMPHCFWGQTFSCAPQNGWDLARSSVEKMLFQRGSVWLERRRMYQGDGDSRGSFP